MNDIWAKYAAVLVDYSTKVKKGDLVVIRTESAASKDLIKAIYKRVLEKGANPIIRAGLGDMSEIFIKYASNEQLEFVDEMTKTEYETVDAFISIGAPLNLKNMARADMKKLAKRSAATRPLSEKLLDRAAKGEASWVIADCPTHALAQEAKMSFDEYSDFVFKSCYLFEDDPVAKLKGIDAKQQKWAKYLDNISTLRVVGEKTDITFSTKGRKWISCAGLNNYPDGEVFTSPIEDATNGQIYFDFPAIYRGNEAHKILLTVKDGRVVEAKAEKGEEFLNSMFDMDEGSRLIGEIAVGTNDMIQEVTGNILFDEKIGGSIHMAVGSSYPETGGKNVSGLHWDLIKNMKNGGEIYADDKLIYKDGKFLI